MISINDAKELSSIYRSVSDTVSSSIDQYIRDASSHGLCVTDIRLYKALFMDRESIDKLLNNYRELGYKIEVIEDSPNNYEVIISWY